MSKKMRMLLSIVGALLLTLPLTCETALAIGASPINAGCYIAAPGQCKIHVDPFTIHVVPGEHLLFYELRANHNAIYSFKTDNSNPPLNNYSPSVVMQDFGATCGTTYYINLVGQDSGDPSAYNLGSVSSVECPASVH